MLSWGVYTPFIVVSMLTKKKKAEIVEELKEKFARQKVAIFSDFRGVSVGQSEKLRRSLKKVDAEYRVARKTLLDRALQHAGMEFRTKELEGEIGVAFGYGDEIAPTKILSRFLKEVETFKILGGILNGKLLSGKEVLALARLPSREILLAQVLAGLSAPLQGLAGVLRGTIRNLAFVLGQVRDTRK